MTTVLALIVLILFLGAISYYFACKNDENNRRLAMHIANGDIEAHLVNINMECEYTLCYHAFDSESNAKPHEFKVSAKSYDEAKEIFTRETGLPSSIIINPVRVVTDEMS